MPSENEQIRESPEQRARRIEQLIHRCDLLIGLLAAIAAIMIMAFFIWYATSGIAPAELKCQKQRLLKHALDRLNASSALDEDTKALLADWLVAFTDLENPLLETNVTEGGEMACEAPL